MSTPSVEAVTEESEIEVIEDTVDLKLVSNAEAIQLMDEEDDLQNIKWYCFYVTDSDKNDEYSWGRNPCETGIGVQVYIPGTITQ